MDKEETRRINLSPLEGSEQCYLEISVHPNSDLFVEMRGQDTKGNPYTVRAQIPFPNQRGGDFKLYQILRRIYKFLSE